ncbi:transcriptional regulator GcvA [Tolumonas lignilytica]|uniref:transcriptional regulator GcvA n=1 Tax=Tolumonas lignilytica TaxID=1283284 RepID=UPI0004679A4C|nr:transcriptional regulator GcvA [Tolumonas lignilytica]
MLRRLPPLNALKAFEAAARHLSFTKAAEELFVTQAAISHQIKTLEEFLGLKLFRRRNRSLLLTEEGQGYYQDIRSIFSSIGEATERLMARSAKGTLTVTMQPSFAIQWLVPRLMLFSQLHPEIDVRIKAVDQDDGTLVDDVDIAIYYGDGHWPDLQLYKLHSEYRIPVCAPSLLQSKQLAVANDLVNFTLLHDGSRRDWARWLQDAGVSIPNAGQGPIFSHSTMVLQAAVLGQGVALGHSLLARPEIKAGRLICPLPQTLNSHKAYYLVMAPGHDSLGKVAAFRDWIMAMVQQEEDEFGSML